MVEEAVERDGSVSPAQTRPGEGRREDEHSVAGVDSVRLPVVLDD